MDSDRNKNTDVSIQRIVTDIEGKKNANIATKGIPKSCSLSTSWDKDGELNQSTHTAPAEETNVEQEEESASSAPPSGEQIGLGLVKFCGFSIHVICTCCDNANKMQAMAWP